MQGNTEQDFKNRFKNFEDQELFEQALNWLKDNLNKVKQIIEDTPASQFIFEPFI